MAPVETSQASQSTTLSAPRRHDGLCSDETTGPDRLVTRRGTTCACSRRESLREPDAGNPHVRFDEGRGVLFASSPTLPPPRIIYGISFNDFRKLTICQRSGSGSFDQSGMPWRITPLVRT